MTPKEIVETNIAGAKNKATNKWWKLLLLGILAGLFIGLGAVASSMAAHGLPGTGLIRLVTGLVFPLGICLVVLLGAELFTGNVLMLNAMVDRKIGWRGLLRNWALVYVGNFIGAVILAAAMVWCEQIGIGGGDLAVYTAKVAATKASMPWLNALTLGIFCNLLVCAAIYLAIGAKSVGGKIVALWVPVAAFAIAGFEHSVANMYYVPAGIFAYWNPAFAQKIIDAGVNTAVLDFGDFSLNNLIPVTIGNIIGGAAIGLVLYFVHCNEKKIRK
ncbi:FdhC protein [Alphaproteobacteria bacterium]|nr:FdhC protein [Alphaproteobacteria bacterium]